MSRERSDPPQTPQRPTPVTRTLCCFDFDLTLTEEHLHARLAHFAGLNVPRETLIERGALWLEREGLRSEEQLWPLFVELLRADHEIAIVTFSSFPELIRAALLHGSRVLRQQGVERALRARLQRIPICFGGPAPMLYPEQLPPHTRLIGGDEWRAGKTAHIRSALAFFEGEASPLLPLLIDDDPENVAAAEAQGTRALLAPRPPDAPTHFDRLGELLCLQSSTLAPQS